MRIESINTTCSQVRQIVRHKNEIRRLLVEDFNIYSILGMERLENNTHSKLIAELLNPKGTHHFGSVFLELFLEETNLQNILDIQSTSVTVEKHIGFVKKASKSGGRIDIYLEDQFGRSISIENKIYANDQDEQLQRYCNHNKGKNQVVYLTLWGNDASENSRGKLKADYDYKLISYQNHILNWVENCQKEAINKENVRTGLSHYINLLKKLTNQNMEADREKELHDVIRSNYAEVRLMADHITAVEREETYKVFQEAQTQLKEILGNSVNIKLSSWDDWQNSWHGMTISFKAGEHDINLHIEGQSRVWQQYTIIGFPKSKNSREAMSFIAPQGFDNTSFGNDKKISKAWHVYKYFLGWDNHEERAKLFDVIERKNNLDYIVNSVIELVKEFSESE